MTDPVTAAFELSFEGGNYPEQQLTRLSTPFDMSVESLQGVSFDAFSMGPSQLLASGITTLFLTGFEHGFIGTGANAGGGLMDSLSSTGWSISASSPRNGSYCAHFVAVASAARNLGRNITGSPTKIVARVGIKASVRPTSGVATILYSNQSSGTAITVQLSSAGVLSAQCGNGSFVNGPTIDTTNWHLLELQLDTAAGTLDWKVDGVLQTRATGTATAPVSLVLGNNVTTQTTFTVDYDDWIFGTWTTASTDWYGDGKILPQLAGSDGTHQRSQDFSPGDSGTIYGSGGVVTAYTMVDDPPTAGASGGWSATRSTTDNLALRFVTTSSLMEILPAPVTAFRSIANTTYASRTNTTVNVPAGVQNGDLLLWFQLTAAATEAPDPTPPAGWSVIPGWSAPTDLSDSGGFNVETRGWYRIASSEPANYTATHAACSSQAVMVAYSGVDNTTPFDVNATTNSGNTDTATALSLTPATNGALIVFFDHDWGSTSVNLVPPTGSTPTFTERLEVNPLVYLADGVLATAGATGNKSHAVNNTIGGSSNGWAAALIALRPATRGQANAVRALVSYSSNAAATNLAGCDARNSESGIATLNGSVGGTGADFGVTANNFKGGIIPAPTAGWTAAEVNAIRFWFGGCVSSDITPPPTVQAFMLEVDWPISPPVTYTDARSGAIVFSGSLVESYVPPPSAYPIEVLADSPLRYYRMGELSGNLVDSSIYHGASIALTGGTRGAPHTGLAGDDGAVSFNGTSDTAQVVLDLSGTSVITLEYWLYWDVNGADDDFVMEHSANANTNNGFNVDQNNSTPGEANTVSVKSTPAAATSGDRFTFPRPSAAAWHHYVIVIDRSGGATTATVYVDGSAVTVTQPETHGSLGPFASQTLYLMSRAGTGLFGAGDMDELAIYKTALSATRVAAHYAARNFGAGIVFNDAPTGTIAFTGAKTEGKTVADVCSGRIAFAGTVIEGRAYTDSRSGTIAITGSVSAESWTTAKTYTDAPSGRLALTGSVVVSHTHSTSAVGTVVFSGTLVESYVRVYTDARTGAILLTGSVVESWQKAGAYSDSPTGTLPLAGTITRSSTHSSSVTGTIRLTGAVVAEQRVYNDARSGSIPITGTRTENSTTSRNVVGTIGILGMRTESYQHSGSTTGVIRLTGSVTEGKRYTDLSTGTIRLTGTIVEIPSYDEHVTGRVNLTGKVIESWGIAGYTFYNDFPVGVIPVRGRIITAGLSRGGGVRSNALTGSQTRYQQGRISHGVTGELTRPTTGTKQ